MSHPPSDVLGERRNCCVGSCVHGYIVKVIAFIVNRTKGLVQRSYPFSAGESVTSRHFPERRRCKKPATISMLFQIRGTHLGGWRGLPATGQRVEFPLCGVYTFDPDDRLAGEKIYYDRGTVLRQLGVFHGPRSLLGQISILATHPATIMRAFVRMLLRR